MIEKFRNIHERYVSIRIITVIFVVIASIAVMLPMIKLAKLFGINIRENTGLNFKVSFGNVLAFFLFGICSIGIIWLAQKYIYQKKITELGFQPKIFSVLIMGFIVGALLVSLKNFTIILNAETVKYTYVITEDVSVFNYVGYYIYFLIGFIFWNSFIEELGTRAYPIEKLKKYINPHIIFTIMGLLFSLGHLVLNDFNFGYFLNLFIASYIYSLLYFYSSSIWLTVGMHSGVNWVGFSFFGTSWKLGAIYNIQIYNVSTWIVEYSNVIIQFTFLLLIIYLHKKGFFEKHFPTKSRQKN